MQDFLKKQYKWLLTGATGFIGSNILEYLMQNNQKVIALDNLSTSTMKNIEEVLLTIPQSKHELLEFHNCDIVDPQAVQKLAKGVDIILHQAAIGSVPRSIKQPDITHINNVDGMFNMLNAARLNNVKAFVYASSSSVYGDEETLPKIESRIGQAISPYGASKYINEVYADVFAKSYNMSIVGLRYFNVFGPRQSIDGPYAAVIPKWINAVINNKPIEINGDGSISRDFTYVDNVVDINVLAAKHALSTHGHFVFNAAAANRITLLELKEAIAKHFDQEITAQFKPIRAGDIPHSFADISKACEILGYNPRLSFEEGIAKTIKWFCNK